jgi:hypothetical protein
MLMSTAKEKGILSFVYVFLIHSVVDFDSPDDVATAIRKLDGTELKGNRVRLTEDPVRDHPKIKLTF